MSFLTREAILSVADLTTETLVVPEWGGAVRIRTMTGTERDQFEADILRSEGDQDHRIRNLRARLCALTLCDETGAPLFTLADLEALGGKSASALNRVFEVASRLNALSDQDVETLGKGSASTPPAGSTSPSLSASAG
jgi:hypothetical protein